MKIPKLIKINRFLILTLLLIESIYIAHHFIRQKNIRKTWLTAQPGKNYSLLVDSERLPIPVHSGDEIHINIIEAGKKTFDLPPRIIIPQSNDEDSRSIVHENRFRFYFNTPEQLLPLYNKEKLSTLRGKNEWEMVLAVMAMAQKDLRNGTPRTYPSQNAVDLLNLMRNGKDTVFCAQYCYLTVQSLQALGFFARYVTIIGHEVCEVWLPHAKQWVALDPTNAIYYVDERGKKLSVVEIAKNLKDTSPLKAKRLDGSLVSLQTIAPPVDGYRTSWFWLCNDLVTHPVNIYDLNKYRVRVILDPKDLENINYGDLYTLDPLELYAAPT